MAKYTLAQVAEKLLAVRAALAQGATVPAACKAAGLSTSTYKKWLATYEDLDLPTWVGAVPEHGAIALSGGRHVLTADASPDGYALRRLDAATGAQSAAALHAERAGDGAWREVLVAGVDERGERLIVVVTGGAMLRWDVARGEVERCDHDLQSGCVPLTGRCGSGARRWAPAALSPDLELVAFWETFGDRDEPAPARLCIRRVADAEVVMRHETTPLFIPSPLVFHPTRPLLALLDDSKLLTVLDLEARRPLLTRGAQMHHASFGPRDTMLYDDWYGRTQELDLRTGESRVTCPRWGAIASLGERFVTVTESDVEVHGAGGARQRHLTLDRIVEALLSRDGNCLAVVANRLCVWNLAHGHGRAMSSTT